METKLKRATMLMGITSICMLCFSIITLIVTIKGLDALPYLTIQLCIISLFLATLGNFMSVKKKCEQHKREQSKEGQEV